MIVELESVSVILSMPNGSGSTTEINFVEGMLTPDEVVVERIVYHKGTGQVQVHHEDGATIFSKNQKQIMIDGNLIHCGIIIGLEKKTRLTPPPPLKRREPTGFYNPLTGESFKVEQAYHQSQKPSPLEQELKIMHEYLAESERKNQVLTEKLNSMRKAYQAEAEENARLKNNMPVPYEQHEIFIDDAGNEIDEYETNDLRRMLSITKARHGNAIQKNQYLIRQLEAEKQVSGELSEQTRKKMIAWGICLTSAQIVQVIFNYLI